MTIPWMYINKNAATVEVLRDYQSMRRIVDSYQDHSTEIQGYLTDPRTATSPRLTKVPNPRAAENKIAMALDLIDIVDERHKQAVEYMAWFQPAWDILSEEDQFLLTELFMREQVRRDDMFQRIVDRLGYEKSAVYNRRDQAIGRLARLLYGK